MPRNTKYRLVIAGSRTFDDYNFLRALIVAWRKRMGMKDWSQVEIVCGEALGVDTLGKRFAKKRGILVKSFVPDYSTGQGRQAPLIRNQLMAEYCTHVLAVWDGVSRGTSHMIAVAKDQRKQVMVVIY